MNWTPHDIEQAWGLTGLVLTNGQATSVDVGDLDLINNRIKRALKAETLNVPRLPSVTPRQLRIWLHRNGKLSNVESALNSLQEPAKTEALTEWEYTSSFDRDNPTVLQIGAALGMNAEEMDTVWLESLNI